MTPTLGIRDGMPAVNVKDRTVWWHDRRTADLCRQLGEEEVHSIYAMRVESFWSDARLLGEEYGYSVWSAGRSGGWLTVSNQDTGHFLSYVTDDAGTLYRNARFEIPPADATADDDTREEYAHYIAKRDRFVEFAGKIEEAMESNAEAFISDLRDAVSELEARREACLVRGEN